MYRHKLGKRNNTKILFKTSSVFPDSYEVYGYHILIKIKAYHLISNLNCFRGP